MNRHARTLMITGWAHTTQALGDLSERLSLLALIEPEPCDPNGFLPVNSEQAWDPEHPSPHAHAFYEHYLSHREPAALIGWSLGSFIALEAAYFWPEYVTRLVLLSPSARFATDHNYPHGQPERTVRGMIRSMKRNRTDRILDAFYTECACPETPETVYKNAGIQSRPTASGTLISGLHYLLHADMRPKLAAIQHPSLLIYGGKDRIIPPAASQCVLEGLINAAPSVSYADSGHVFPITHSRDVAMDVIDFLE